MTTRRRVHVDPNLCEAHALCIESAPDVFDLGDDIASCAEYPDVADWELVESAVAACPRGAITLIDADPPALSSFEKDQ